MDFPFRSKVNSRQSWRAFIVYNVRKWRVLTAQQSVVLVNANKTLLLNQKKKKNGINTMSQNGGGLKFVRFFWVFENINCFGIRKARTIHILWTKSVFSRMRAEEKLVYKINAVLLFVYMWESVNCERFATIFSDRNTNLNREKKKKKQTICVLCARIQCKFQSSKIYFSKHFNATNSSKYKT